MVLQRDNLSYRDLGVINCMLFKKFVHTVFCVFPGDKKVKLIFIGFSRKNLLKLLSLDTLTLHDNLHSSC